MGYMLSKNKPVATTWDNLSSKPAILSDNQISWEELQNKPDTFPPSSPATLTGSPALIVNANAPGIRFTEVDSTTDNKDWYLVFDGNIFQLQTRPDNFGSVLSTPLMIDRSGNMTILGKFKNVGIPNSSTGLSTGQFYRDSNGFVKVVI